MLGEIKSILKYVDEDGSLIPIESLETIPFAINRLFFISEVKEKAKRGNHVSMNASFAFVALCGEVYVTLDDGIYSKTYHLNCKSDILLVDKGTWIVAERFSEDAILMVVSDKKYNECEYINEYSEFLKKIV